MKTGQVKFRGAMVCSEGGECRPKVREGFFLGGPLRDDQIVANNLVVTKGATLAAVPPNAGHRRSGTQKVSKNIISAQMSN